MRASHERPSRARGLISPARPIRVGLAAVVTALVLAGCGGDDTGYEEVPGRAPTITVPQPAETPAADEGAENEDPGAGTDEDGGTAEPGAAEDGASGGAAAPGEAEPPAADGGAAAPGEGAAAGGGATGGATPTGDGTAEGAAGGATGGAGATGGTSTGESGETGGGTQAPESSEGASADPTQFKAFCERNPGACSGGA